ncbi:hypothetical protein MMC24_000582 [Lignoscripta atroalba]|nr:hypothetical protein [Lignoscripta atroalba]
MAYFYYDFNEEDEKEGHAAVFDSVPRLPSERQFFNTFPKVVGHFDRFWIVVDSMDESVEKDEFPADLTSASNIHALPASRYHDDIALALS